MTDITPEAQNAFSRTFLRHPQDVGETYWQHFAASAGYALLMARLCGCAALHAVVPSLCEKTVSTRILALAADIQARQR